MNDKIWASLFVTYILGVLFAVVGLLGVSWWGWVLFAVFVGTAIPMIGNALEREIKNDAAKAGL